MIFAKNTPNSLGVAVYGDRLDFENLYDALHTVVGDEGEFDCEAARLRVLGVCFDIRHALMGHREFAFVDNGMDETKSVNLGVIAPNKNLYLKFYVLWPEVLFVAMALNHFVELYSKTLKGAKGRHLFVEENVVWVRMFQSAVYRCLASTVSKQAFSRVLNLLNNSYIDVYGYLTQYIDFLNHHFAELSSEERPKNLLKVAIRMSKQGTEYDQLERELLAAAAYYNCSVEDVRLNLRFPDVEW